MAVKALSRRLPALRLYQQIILYVVLVVFVPLLTVSFVIYTINQKALKKELVRFTEHTAEIIYTDITAQLDAQEAQVRLMGKVLADGLQRQRTARDVLQQVLALSTDVEALALYDADGQQLIALSRPRSQQPKTSKHPAAPVSLLPKALTSKAEAELRFSLSPQWEPTTGIDYLLLAESPLRMTRKPRGGRPAVRFVLLRRLDSLGNLVRSQNEKLYKGFYLISAQGDLLAGPANIMQEAVQHPQVLAARWNNTSQANPTQWAKELKDLEPGVTEVVSEADLNLVDNTIAWLQPVLNSVGISAIGDDDTAPAVEKVLMKLPNGWGVVLESPYEVRQKYVKRARTQTLLLILAHLILAGGFTALYIGGLRRNFRQLIKGIQALAEGRYSRRIRLLTNWFTPFEIIYLTGEFNRMIRKREEAWEESESLTNELRRANDKLAELDKMKSNLIDTVSHELRTPLTSIKGYTSRLIRYDDSLDAETRLQNLKTIKRQADRLNRLVDDLLVIPELEQHHLRVELQPVVLAAVLERARAIVASRQDHAPMQVTWADGVSADEASVQADPDRLEQVLTNLLDNAQKYGEADVPIEVTIAPVGDLDSNQIAITVANTCPAEFLPASPEIVAGLFEKFRRLDDTTTRTTRGTGLGLYITQGLVEAMGGTITAGVDHTTFWVRFTLSQI